MKIFSQSITIAALELPIQCGSMSKHPKIPTLHEQNYRLPVNWFRLSAISRQRWCFYRLYILAHDPRHSDCYGECFWHSGNPDFYVGTGKILSERR